MKSSIFFACELEFYELHMVILRILLMPKIPRARFTLLFELLVKVFIKFPPLMLNRLSFTFLFGFEPVTKLDNP